MRCKHILLPIFLVLLVSLTVSAEQYESDENTLLLLHFDKFSSIEISEYGLIDFSNNYEKVFVNGHSNLVKGIENKSLFIEKDSANVVRIPEKKENFLKNSFTIEMYVLYFENYTQPLLSEMGREGQLDPIFQISKSGKLTSNLIQIINGTRGDYKFESENILNPNKWYHIAIVYNNPSISFYINGNLDKKENIGEISRLLGKSEDSGYELKIGRSKYVYGCKNSLYGCVFNGLIDELRISTIAREDFNINSDALSEIITEEQILEEIKLEKQKQLEEDNWRIAKETNTISSYSLYIENFPKGIYVSEANLKIEKLIEIEEQNILAKEEQQKEIEELQQKETLKKWTIFLLVSIFIITLLFYFHKREKQKKEEERKQQEIEREKKKKQEEQARLLKQKQKEEFEESQRKKGLELFDGKWVGKKEIPKLKEIKIGLDKNFQNLSSYDFEKFIAKLFKAMGYKTRVTQASNDYGIDVVAEKGNEKIAIQCKRYRPGNPVGNRDIQRLLGAMQLKNVRATHSVIITTSHFTVQAKEQAKECAIELWDRYDLEKMVKKYLMDI